MTQIIEGFQLIGQSFVKEPSIWWFLTPVFILWIVMEIYFGQYKKESCGWNTILANGISFSWINIASFRVLFLENSSVIDFQLRMVILALFFLYGIFIIYIAFTHKLPEKVGSWLAGPTTIYFLSTVSILWGQGVLEISKWILIDFIILYFIIRLIFWLIKKRLGVLGEVEAINKGQNPL
jgi:hypothetical protein